MDFHKTLRETCCFKFHHRAKFLNCLILYCTMFVYIFKHCGYPGTEPKEI